MRSVQDLLFSVWYESRDSVGGEEFKILLCKPSGGNFLRRQNRSYNLVKHPRGSSFAKTANGLNTLTASAKKPSNRTPNADPAGSVVNVGHVEWTAGAWNS